MHFRVTAVWMIAISLTLCVIGCQEVLEELLGIDYELSISAPDTVHTASVPVSPRFTVHLKKLGLSVSDVTVRVGGHNFITDTYGEAECYQRFTDFGSGMLRAEALDTAFQVTVIASAEKSIFIAP